MSSDQFEILLNECKGKKSEEILEIALGLFPSGDIETISYLYEILKSRKRQKFANQLFREMENWAWNQFHSYRMLEKLQNLLKKLQKVRIMFMLFY